MDVLGHAMVEAALTLHEFGKGVVGGNDPFNAGSPSSG
jgi:hypothetical protein